MTYPLHQKFFQSAFPKTFVPTTLPCGIFWAKFKSADLAPTEEFSGNFQQCTHDAEFKHLRVPRLCMMPNSSMPIWRQLRSFLEMNLKKLRVKMLRNDLTHATSDSCQWHEERIAPESIYVSVVSGVDWHDSGLITPWLLRNFMFWLRKFLEWDRLASNMTGWPRRPTRGGERPVAHFCASEVRFNENRL